ncbi:MAG TPA: chemotaxis protein CheD [Chloroflexota bacterium]|jgi:chemotaxis protein CheD
MQLTVTTHSAGLGEMTVVRDSDAVLAARGLGSCVGIAAYEPHRRIAIMAHVMLPGPVSSLPDPAQPARYASHAVDSIIKAVEKHGGRPRDLVIKLAGGAQVIQLHGKDDRLRVGERNISAVREALAAKGLRASAEHMGGSTGRTLCLNAATGHTTVRVVGGQEQPL